MSLAGLPERCETWHCWWYLFYRESRPVPKSLPKWKSALFERICSVGGGDIWTIWGDSLFGANCTICGTLYYVKESALFGEQYFFGHFGCGLSFLLSILVI